MNYQCESCLTRQKILDSLALTSMYLNQLSTVLKMDRSTLAYHLGVLEKQKLIKSHYEILDSKHAARFYALISGG